MAIGQEAIGKERQQDKLGQRQQLVPRQREARSPRQDVSPRQLEESGNVPQVHRNVLIGTDITQALQRRRRALLNLGDDTGSTTGGGHQISEAVKRTRALGIGGRRLDVEIFLGRSAFDFGSAGRSRLALGDEAAAAIRICVVTARRFLFFCRWKGGKGRRSGKRRGSRSA